MFCRSLPARSRVARRADRDPINGSVYLLYTGTIAHCQEESLYRDRKLGLYVTRRFLESRMTGTDRKSGACVSSWENVIEMARTRAMRTVAQGNDAFPHGRILPKGGTANLVDRRVRDAVGRSRLLAGDGDLQDAQDSRRESKHRGAW
jgi:hypothetical protein